MDVIDLKPFLEHFYLKTHHNSVMELSIFVDDDDVELKKIYCQSASTHNNKLFEDPHFYDAGFDLFLPKNDCNKGTKFFKESLINKVNFKVKCCAKMYNLDQTHLFYYTPFYTYTRSSMSKTPLRLANNQGIIDAGYRGSLMGMFDCIYSNPNKKYPDECDWFVEDYSRMLQICAPNLVPIYVRIVDNIDELGPNTSRGEGGFGSTGK